MLLCYEMIAYFHSQLVCLRCCPRKIFQVLNNISFRRRSSSRAMMLPARPARPMARAIQSSAKEICIADKYVPKREEDYSILHSPPLPHAGNNLNISLVRVSLKICIFFLSRRTNSCTHLASIAYPKET